MILIIITVLPEPAVITKLQDQEVCYKSTSGLTQSELIVYDVTGEQTFHTAIMETRPNDTICRDVGFSLSVPIQLCAPYKISIKVYNNIGFSYTNKTILSSMSRLESEDELSRNETEDNQCACLKRSG